MTLVGLKTARDVVAGDISEHLAQFAERAKAAPQAKLFIVMQDRDGHVMDAMACDDVMGCIGLVEMAKQSLILGAMACDDCGDV